MAEFLTLVVFEDDHYNSKALFPRLTHAERYDVSFLGKSTQVVARGGSISGFSSLFEQNKQLYREVQ